MRNLSKCCLLVGHAVLELLIKTLFCMFWSIIQKQLGLLKFECYCRVSHNLLQDDHIVFQSVDNFKINFGLGCSSPLSSINYKICLEMLLPCFYHSLVSYYFLSKSMQSYSNKIESHLLFLLASQREREREREIEIERGNIKTEKKNHSIKERRRRTTG